MALSKAERYLKAFMPPTIVAGGQTVNVIREVHNEHRRGMCDTTLRPPNRCRIARQILPIARFPNKLSTPILLNPIGQVAPRNVGGMTNHCSYDFAATQREANLRRVDLLLTQRNYVALIRASREHFGRFCVLDEFKESLNAKGGDVVSKQ